MSPERADGGVVHVITTLDVGGAETALTNLVTEGVPGWPTASVVSLRPEGHLARRLRDSGVPVMSLGLEGALSAAAALPRLVSLIRSLRPHVVQTWMYHADLLGGIAARIARVPVIAWNLRQSNLSSEGNTRATLSLVRLSARLSRWIPDVIVAGSDAAAESHRAVGYDGTKIHTIANGFAIGPSSEAARAAVRSELDLTPSDLVVLRMARFHPQKDYETMARAAGAVAARFPEARFVFCGAGVDWDNDELAGWVRATGREQAFRLVGERDDTDALYSAADIACSSSWGEGFPNVIGEAMAAGVPVVTTDAGDSARIVGDSGVVVPARDPNALAEAIGQLVSAPSRRHSLGEAARQRVITCFSLARMAAEYDALYSELAARVRD